MAAEALLEEVWLLLLLLLELTGLAGKPPKAGVWLLNLGAAAMPMD